MRLPVDRVRVGERIMWCGQTVTVQRIDIDVKRRRAARCLIVRHRGQLWPLHYFDGETVERVRAVRATTCSVPGCGRSAWAGGCRQCDFHRVHGGPSCSCVRCDPLYCPCPDPVVNRIGECQRCRRLVEAHSWHAGIPVNR